MLSMVWGFRAALLSVAAPRASLPFVSADSCWTRLRLCRLCTTTLQSDLHFISFQHRLLLQQQLSWVLDWSFSFTLKERWSKFVSCLLCRCYPGFVHCVSGSVPSSCSELQQLSYQLQQHCALGVPFPYSFVTSLLEVCTLSLQIPGSTFNLPEFTWIWASPQPTNLFFMCVMIEEDFPACHQPKIIQ